MSRRQRIANIRRARRIRRLRQLMASAGFEGNSLFEDLNPTFFLVPESGTPGLNAVTGVEDFTLSGTADGYTTGPAGQEVIQLSSSDSLTAVSGNFAGTFMEELHDQSKFWVAIFWKPSSASTWQVGLQTASGANAGWRMRMHGDGTGGQAYVHDGVTGVGMPWPTIAQGSEWQASGPNMVLYQVNVPDQWHETWFNGWTSRTAAFNRRSLSTLTNFPTLPTTTANTVDAVCSLDGDVMFVGGEGVLNAKQVRQLMRFGKGLSWTEFNATSAKRVISWRGAPGTTTLDVTGCFADDPNLKIYADTDQHTRGALVEESGQLTRNSRGWATHQFTGLSADTTYQVYAEYNDGEQDYDRLRLKTLPTDLASGVRLLFAGCWRWENTDGLPWSNAESLESQTYSTMKSIIKDEAFDMMISTGDDGYYDNEWVDHLSGTLPVEAVADYQTIHEYIFDDDEQYQIRELFARVPFDHGPFSDHDFLENDTFAADTTAANIAAASAHWEDRTLHRTYPVAGCYYYSRNEGGVTYIYLDTRTESEAGVQLTSSAQRTQLQTDVEAAVGRGDLIVLVNELGWDEDEAPSPSASWNNFTSERQAIFNILANAGVRDRIICVYGDQHGGGLDLNGTFQGGWDTNSVVRPISIKASRLNHESGTTNGSGTHPDYNSALIGQNIYANIVESADQFWFEYDGESGGPFTVAETLTFGNGATATLDKLEDNGATGYMWCTLLTGSIPGNNSSITGGTSSATANVNSQAGTVQIQPMLDVTVKCVAGATEQTGSPFSRTI